MVGMEHCSKCEGDEIYKVETGCQAPLRRGSASVPAKWFVQMFVCGDCGYSESYVKPEDIPRVRELAERQTRLTAAAETLSIVR